MVQDDERKSELMRMGERAAQLAEFMLPIMQKTMDIEAELATSRREAPEAAEERMVCRAEMMALQRRVVDLQEAAEVEFARTDVDGDGDRDTMGDDSDEA